MKPNEGYAKLKGKDVEYFIQKLSVTLGRTKIPKNNDSNSSNNDQLPETLHSLLQEQTHVDIPLGTNKNISRKHAAIIFNYQTRFFDLHVYGKNGAKVDGQFYNSNSIIPLRNGAEIQLGEAFFIFVQPVRKPNIFMSLIHQLPNTANSNNNNGDANNSNGFHSESHNSSSSNNNSSGNASSSNVDSSSNTHQHTTHQQHNEENHQQLQLPPSVLSTLNNSFGSSLAQAVAQTLDGINITVSHRRLSTLSSEGNNTTSTNTNTSINTEKVQIPATSMLSKLILSTLHPKDGSSLNNIHHHNNFRDHNNGTTTTIDLLKNKKILAKVLNVALVEEQKQLVRLVKANKEREQQGASNNGNANNNLVGSGSGVVANVINSKEETENNKKEEAVADNKGTSGNNQQQEQMTTSTNATNAVNNNDNSTTNNNTENTTKEETVEKSSVPNNNSTTSTQEVEKSNTTKKRKEPSRRKKNQEKAQQQTPVVKKENIVITYQKPDLPYSTLIAQALNDSDNKMLPLQSIYQWITEHYPYFKSDETGWKSSIRHNLSTNPKYFRKVEKDEWLSKNSTSVTNEETSNADSELMKDEESTTTGEKSENTETSGSSNPKKKSKKSNSVSVYALISEFEKEVLSGSIPSKKKASNSPGQEDGEKKKRKRKEEPLPTPPTEVEKKELPVGPKIKKKKGQNNVANNVPTVSNNIQVPNNVTSSSTTPSPSPQPMINNTPTPSSVNIMDQLNNSGNSKLVVNTSNVPNVHVNSNLLAQLGFPQTNQQQPSQQQIQQGNSNNSNLQLLQLLNQLQNPQILSLLQQKHNQAMNSYQQQNNNFQNSNNNGNNYNPMVNGSSPNKNTSLLQILGAQNFSAPNINMGNNNNNSNGVHVSISPSTLLNHINQQPTNNFPTNIPQQNQQVFPQNNVVNRNTFINQTTGYANSSQSTQQNAAFQLMNQLRMDFSNPGV
ncbi:hypothetical protein ABK040_003126 [Willaertia magna]